MRGVGIQEPLNKWQFSAILSEELMKFTAVVDSYNMIYLHCEMPSILEKINKGHFPTTNLDTVRYVCSAICLHLICAVCSIEETDRCSFKIKTTRQLSQNMKGMAY